MGVLHVHDLAFSALKQFGSILEPVVRYQAPKQPQHVIHSAEGEF